MSNQPKSSLPIDVLLQLERGSSSWVRWLYIGGIVVAILLAIAALTLGILLPKADEKEAATRVPTATVTLPSTEIPQNMGHVKTANAILRAEPNPDAAVVGVINSGSVVIIDQRLGDNSWYKVAYTATAENGEALPTINGWMEATQLEPSPLGVRVAAFEPTLAIEPEFDVLIYQQELTSIAYVGSSDPIQIIVQSPDPDAVNKNILLEVEGSGVLGRPGESARAANLSLTLDEKGYGLANFYALPPISDITINVKVPGTNTTDMVLSDSLTFTTRQESLTLSISPELQPDGVTPVTAIELLDTPMFYTINLGSDTISNIPHNYPVTLTLENLGVLVLVQRNLDSTSPPDPNTPPSPFLPIPDNPSNLSIEMQPNVPNSNYGIVLTNKDVAPFEGTNTLTVTVGDITQEIEIAWRIPCYISNITNNSLLIGKEPVSGGQLVHFESGKTIRALGRLAEGTFFLVDITDIAPEGVTATDGWLEADANIRQSASCAALPIVDVNKQPVQNNPDVTSDSNQQTTP